MLSTCGDPLTASQRRGGFRAAVLPVTLALAAVFAAPQTASAADAFNALKGSWSGGGKASFA